MLPQYTQPFNQQQQSQLLQQMLTNGTTSNQKHITRVNGRPGAEAYILGPDSDDLLIDNTAPIIWLVQTDGAGYKSLTPYDISLHKEEKQEDLIKQLETRIEKLEERIDAKSNTKSNNSEYRRKPEHNVSGVRGNDER